MPLRALGLLLPFLLIFTTPVAAQTQPLDRIIAIVEEDVILQSELDEAIANIRAQFQGKESQLPPDDVLRKQVLERMTLVRLQVQRASSAGVQITDTEIDEALARIAAGNQLTLAQMRMAIEQDGLDYGEFRKSMRDELMVQKLRNRVVESRVNVSDAEIDRALASSDIKRGEVRLGHILVAMPEGATPEQVETARGKAEGIRKVIQEGEIDFTAAAIRFSDAPQALEGGELGWRRYDQIPEAFSDLVAGMQVGEVSPPLRTPTGFHLLKVIEEREETKIVVTEYLINHLVVDVTDLVSEQQALRKIENARQRVIDGEDFGEVAKVVSDDKSTANLGGSLGWIQIDRYGPFYAEPLSQLLNGQVSAPLRSDKGWHIIQRVDVRQTDRTVDVVRSQVRENLFQAKAEEAYDAFLRQLRSESFIETRLDGDSATS
jgi:peptidyl-prolyl cis-trans isomerase SurA